MVKCPICGQKFLESTNFYKHWREKHAENEVEKQSYGLKTKILERTEENLDLIGKWDKTEMIKKYGKFVDAVINKDTITVRYIPNVKQAEWYISVWDCIGTLNCPHTHEKKDYYEIGRFVVPPCLNIKGNEKEIEMLLWEVLDDNGGAINISGIYYLDVEHMEKLRKFLR